MSTNLDDKVDKLEAAVDPNTVISIGGYSFTPAKLMIAAGIISSTLGGLYGAFEVYKDYQSMKEAIQQYVTPDLSEINKKIAVLEESTSQAVDYTRDINNNLKGDIRRIEGVLDTTERNVRQSQRDVDLTVKEVNRSVDNTIKEINQSLTKLQRDLNVELRAVRTDTDASIKNIENELKRMRSEVDEKIKKALDNPLSK